jgi:hypothetical protein
MLPPEQMSEAYFRKNIINPWLDRYSEYWIPTTGMFCRNGVPDYSCVINGAPVYIEVKKVGGKLSGYQVNEIRRIHKAKILVFVVHPLNWDQIAKRILYAVGVLGLKAKSETVGETDRRYISDITIYTIIDKSGNC